MIRIMIVALSFTALACGASETPAQVPTTRGVAQALDGDAAAACRRVTRWSIDAIIAKIRAAKALALAEANGGPAHDVSYYDNAEVRLLAFRGRADLHFSDDAPDAVPTPATIENLPYDLAFTQSDLYVGRYLSGVRPGRTGRTRVIGVRVGDAAHAIEDLAAAAFLCHEGVAGVPALVGP